MIRVSLKDFPKNPGIYKFINKFNGKIYIGESLNMKKRMFGYFYNYQKRTDQRIYRAMRKYGLDGFDCYIVETFPINTKKQILIEREKFWISFYNSNNKEVGYNLCSHGLNNSGLKRSEDSKKRMKEVRKFNNGFKKGSKHSENTKKKMSLSHLGKTLSEETKKKMSIAKKNNNVRKGVKLSSEIKNKISLSKSGENHPFYKKEIPWLKKNRKIKQIDPVSGNVIQVWESASQAAKNLFEKYSVDATSIRRAVSGERKSAHGFLWKK